MTVPDITRLDATQQQRAAALTIAATVLRTSTGFAASEPALRDDIVAVASWIFSGEYLPDESWREFAENYGTLRAVDNEDGPNEP